MHASHTCAKKITIASVAIGGMMIACARVFCEGARIPMDLYYPTGHLA